MKYFPTQYVWLLIMVIAVVTAFFLYFPTHSYSSINWDDDENIRSNPTVHDLSIDHLKEHFQNNRYKSIALWSYSIQYQVSGKNFGAYHMVNLLFHIVNILLVFFLVSKLLKKKILAAIAALLFALHPMFVEPVAWITGRKDLLYMLFFLLSLISYHKFLKSEGITRFLFILLSIGLTFVASMAKIQAFTIPVVFILMDIYYKRKLSLEIILEKLLIVALLVEALYYIALSLIAAYVFLFVYTRIYSKEGELIKKLSFADNPLFKWIKFLSGLALVCYLLSVIEGMKAIYGIRFPEIVELTVLILLLLYLSFGLLIQNIPRLKALDQLKEKLKPVPVWIQYLVAATIIATVFFSLLGDNINDQSLNNRSSYFLFIKFVGTLLALRLVPVLKSLRTADRVVGLVFCGIIVYTAVRDILILENFLFLSFVVKIFILFLTVVITFREKLSASVKELTEKIKKGFLKIPVYINSNKKVIIVILILLVLSGSYILLKPNNPFSLSFFSQQPGDPEYFPLDERLILGALSLLFYLKGFLAPGSYNPMHKYPDLHNPELYQEYRFSVFLAVLIVIVSLFLIIRYWKRYRHIIFWAIFFFIQIGIVLHIIPIEGKVVVADRYAYPAYLGLIVAFVLILDKLQTGWKRPWLFMSLVPIMTVFFALGTHARIPAWKDSKSFWEKAIKEDHDNAYAHYSLAQHLQQNRNYPEAIANYDKALKYNPDLHEAYANKGLCYTSMKNYQKAIELFDTAIKVNPDDAFAYNNRGAIKLRLLKYEQAKKDYLKALEIYPGYLHAKNNLKRVKRLIRLNNGVYDNPSEYYTFLIDHSMEAFKINDITIALESLRKAIEFDPYKPDAYYYISDYYTQSSLHKLAINILSEGLEKIPDNPDLLFFRGLSYLNTNERQKACKDFKKASALGLKNAEEALKGECM